MDLLKIHAIFHYLVIYSILKNVQGQRNNNSVVENICETSIVRLQVDKKSNSFLIDNRNCSKSKTRKFLIRYEANINAVLQWTSLSGPFSILNETGASIINLTLQPSYWNPLVSTFYQVPDNQSVRIDVRRDCSSESINQIGDGLVATQHSENPRLKIISCKEQKRLVNDRRIYVNSTTTLECDLDTRTLLLNYDVQCEGRLKCSDKDSVESSSCEVWRLLDSYEEVNISCNEASTNETAAYNLQCANEQHVFGFLNGEFSSSTSSMGVACNRTGTNSKSWSVKTSGVMIPSNLKFQCVKAHVKPTITATGMRTSMSSATTASSGETAASSLKVKKTQEEYEDAIEEHKQNVNILAICLGALFLITITTIILAGVLFRKHQVLKIEVKATRDEVDVEVELREPVSRSSQPRAVSGDLYHSLEPMNSKGSIENPASATFRNTNAYEDIPEGPDLSEESRLAVADEYGHKKVNGRPPPHSGGAYEVVELDKKAPPKIEADSVQPEVQGETYAMVNKTAENSSNAKKADLTPVEHSQSDNAYEFQPPLPERN